MAENYKSTYRSAHLYQIFSYVKNLDRNNTGNVSGLLLYAKTDEEGLSQGNSVRIGSNTIGVEVIELNSDFNDIVRQLDKILVEYL